MSIFIYFINFITLYACLFAQSRCHPLCISLCFVPCIWQQKPLHPISDITLAAVPWITLSVLCRRIIRGSLSGTVGILSHIWSFTTWSSESVICWGTSFWITGLFGGLSLRLWCNMFRASLPICAVRRLLIRQMHSALMSNFVEHLAAGLRRDQFKKKWGQEITSCRAKWNKMIVDWTPRI